MPPVPQRKKRRVLRYARWGFLAVSIGLLGYVGYSLVDAKIYQSYETWRFNRAMAKLPATPSSQARTVPVSVARVIVSQPVVQGEVIGRLEISRIGISVIIAEGTDRKTLRRAVGHVPRTALPGELGNVGISGHRDTFFRPLRNIRQDDEITLATLNGAYRYRVDKIEIVGPEDTEVLDSSYESVLTLVTCYPFYYVGPAPKRFIVRAHRL